MAIEWTADALILSSRKFGETDAIVEVLTDEHGRVAAFVKGAQGRQHRAALQPGNKARVTWRSRLADQLGRFTIEPTGSVMADILTDPDRLLALSALTATLVTALPEREALPDLMAAVEGVLTLIQLGTLEEYGAGLVKLDLAILGLLGYGLDLSLCAATGTPDDLVFVSPKSGRAVSRAAGAQYQDQLLRLPPFLVEDRPVTRADIRDGLTLSQFFLSRNVWVARKDGLPAGRQRFFDHISMQVL